MQDCPLCGTYEGETTHEGDQMKSFPHPNPAWNYCPICKTRADQPVALAPVPDTGDGRICEAKQVHEECWNLAVKMTKLEDEE